MAGCTQSLPGIPCDQRYKVCSLCCSDPGCCPSTGAFRRTSHHPLSPLPFLCSLLTPRDIVCQASRGRHSYTYKSGVGKGTKQDLVTFCWYSEVASWTGSESEQSSKRVDLVVVFVFGPRGSYVYSVGYCRCRCCSTSRNGNHGMNGLNFSSSVLFYDGVMLPRCSCC